MADTDWYRYSYKGTYAGAELDGPYESYYENGQLRVKNTFVAGEWDGPFEIYHENGQLREKGTLNMGEKCGVWQEPGWFGRTRTQTYPSCLPGLEDGN